MTRRIVPRWAVTGPTGAGKSRFCAVLARRGAVVVDADAEGHAALDLPTVRDAVVAAFGHDIVGDDGRIDRRRLGPRVFAEPQARARLAALVHPALAPALVARRAAAVRTQPPLVILEAAVYFLLPGPPPVDLTVTVTATEPVRFARLIAKGLSPADTRSRIAAQAHLEPLWRRAARIIENDGSETALAAHADRLWRESIAPHAPEG